MPTIHSRAWVRAPIDEVFTFFDDPNNLGRLMPPPVEIRAERVEPSPPSAGSEITFRYGIGPLRRRWTVKLLERVPPTLIVDETLEGPMHRFHHSHLFHPATRGGTWIEDRIDYHVGPDGLVGRVVDWVAGRIMRGTFVWRAARQRQLLRG